MPTNKRISLTSPTKSTLWLYCTRVTGLTTWKVYVLSPMVPEILVDTFGLNFLIFALLNLFCALKALLCYISLVAMLLKMDVIWSLRDYSEHRSCHFYTRNTTVIKCNYFYQEHRMYNICSLHFLYQSCETHQHYYHQLLQMGKLHVRHNILSTELMAELQFESRISSGLLH